ncbi:hypothetical protein F4860DRAFT_171892 [Xylaria cubensis]|nr:hypothetical protein F4860DRAFT_171892 [Xylaria cubensis]
MANHTPRVSASLCLDLTTYSVSSDKPPHLNLTITSHYTEAITIFADDLSPRLIVQSGCALIITDLADNTIVKQTKRTNCRIPLPQKVAVSLDESLFYTLYPNRPLTLSALFTGPSKRHAANGVDSLKPGHRYIITLSSSQRLRWNRIRWWEYGTKDEVLAKGLDAREVRYGRGPHEPIEIDITGILEKPIYLDCEN